MMSKRKYHPIEVTIKKEASNFGIHKVLIALSGGADSIATAFSLKQTDIAIRALHCNFHLRAEESNRDMEFVKEFCAIHDIPLEIKEFDVNDYMKHHKGISVEMACRDLRHDWFRLKLTETGYDRIATGHNADDNIETFFLNLLRGSGTRGLKGMTKDNGVLWRPILQFHRNEILEYLEGYNLRFVVDSTNLQNDYRRNLIRNTIIPLFKEEWKGFNASLDKTIRNLSAENQIVEYVINNALSHSDQSISVSTIMSSPAPLLLIKRYIDPLGPFSTTAEEILSSIKANKPHIRRWRLKDGDVFLRNGNLFIEMIHGK